MKKGFTLIELMVVVVILAMLASIAVPLYEKSVNRSRQAEDKLLEADVVRTLGLAYNEDLISWNTNGGSASIFVVTLNGAVNVAFSSGAAEAYPDAFKNQLEELLPPNPAFKSKGVTQSGDAMNGVLQPVGYIYIEVDPFGNRLPTKWYTANGYLLDMN